MIKIMRCWIYHSGNCRKLFAKGKRYYNMWLPKIHGYIDRRILVNFTAEPGVVRKIVPEPFRPKIYKEKAIVGICLIRLKKV